VQVLPLYLVGTGLVGGTLLDQMAGQRRELADRHSIRIELVGLADSRFMKLDNAGIPMDRWRESLESGAKSDLATFVDVMKSARLPYACFCDCTASDSVASRYEEILESSIAVVTPNKKANSGSMERYRNLAAVARNSGAAYRYETTVGAGLPVIGPIRDMVSSGDRIMRIEAALSGSVGFILSGLAADRSFSALVREASKKGFTEPDPREDLSARDIARKALILARESGFSPEFEDIAIDPLVPGAWFEARSVADFYTALEREDATYERKRVEAASRGAFLRYVATIHGDGSASISMREAGQGDPFHALSGPDNMIVITSERYRERPLVVQGPGAGAEVTAAGVFADILHTII